MILLSDFIFSALTISKLFKKDVFIAPNKKSPQQHGPYVLQELPMLAG